MSKLKCKCGNVMSTVRSPNEIEGWIVTDRQVDNKESFDSTDIIMGCRCVWECKCGRLAISHPEFDDNTVKWYSPDDGEYGGLMTYGGE